MNNTKITKKARIGIAALAAIMTMSFAAPLATYAAAPNGAADRAAATAEDNKDNGGSNGRKNSTTMSSGKASDYYYKGVGLQDTTCKEKENHYLYISESFSTTKRNEAKADLYFLTVK